ncbi:hypothetical protein HU200_061637 [Digitaria exilis]|uniref:RING-type domain-containing protein n=1 Tax=Digitaria exilis TaxID=1010633 RepID=A0A835ACA9_9POAL|nr:hypothetical protein HU200_061637 [Digitaria exilis]CAB3481292.1 unnamed protein product [Digitaria exilis]
MPAPAPPATAAPPPPPPPPIVLYYCYECGGAVDVGDTPLPIPPSSPLRVCPFCCGFLEENPPPPSSPQEPVLLYCHECSNAVDVSDTPLAIPPSSPPLRVLCPSCHRGYLEESPPPLPELPEPVPYYCAQCGSTVDLHNPPPRLLCPRCHRGFLVESHPPPPPPPPPPFPEQFDFDDDIDLLSTDYDAARAFISRFVNQGPDEGPLLGNFAAVAAMSALRDNPHRPAIEAAFNNILQRQFAVPPPPPASEGGEPPAPAATIAALPIVEVAEPGATCAICKDDLPLASQARKLPCSHLYHSTCIVTWLEIHNSCPVCRFRIPAAAGTEGQDSPATQITIRFSTSTRRRGRFRVRGGAGASAPISASPTQLAQAVTGDAAGGPANSGETVSSEWPQHPESDTVMSEAREEDGGFFD